MSPYGYYDAKEAYHWRIVSHKAYEAKTSLMITRRLMCEEYERRGQLRHAIWRVIGGITSAWLAVRNMEAGVKIVWLPYVGHVVTAGYVGHIRHEDGSRHRHCLVIVTGASALVVHHVGVTHTPLFTTRMLEEHCYHVGHVMTHNENNTAQCVTGYCYQTDERHHVQRYYERYILIISFVVTGQFHR